MSVTLFVGLVYFVFFVVQDGVALQDDLLDLLEPALRRSQGLGGLSYFVGLSVRMAVDDQTTRLGAVHVEPLSILGPLAIDLSIPGAPLQMAALGLHAQTVGIEARQPQLADIKQDFWIAVESRPASTQRNSPSCLTARPGGSTR